MSRGKTSYLLTNENTGENVEICGMRAVANFIGCVDSTVYYYQDSGKPYNGWLIQVKGMCNRNERIIPNGYKKKIHYKEKDWKYHTYYPKKKTIVLWKTFYIPFIKGFDFVKLDITVKKAIQLLVKKLKKDLDEEYIVYSEIPRFLNGKKESTKSLYYLELHFKFREIDTFKEWVNYLVPWIDRIDTYIKKLIENDTIT